MARSVMAPLAVADTRDVMVEMPDGSLQPVTGIPRNVTDEDVAKKYGGRIMSKAEDVVRSAASGVPFGLSETVTAIPKAILGMRRMAGLYEEGEWKQKAGQVQALEQAMKRLTGANYSPRSKAGEYAKSATASAVPIPGLGPLGPQAGLGALSGLMAQGAGDLGLGPIGSTVAATLPFIGAAGASAVRSRHPVARTREALDALTPEQRATMYYNVRMAQENGLPLMAWQAAPEGSELRNLGRSVAGQPQSLPIRNVMTRQAQEVTGDKSLMPPTQAATTRIGGPLYDAIRNDPVTPDVSQAIQNNIMRIIGEKQLAKGSPQYNAVVSVAEQFGKRVEVPMVETVARLQQELKALPMNDPKRMALQKEIVGRINGTIPPESVFVSDIQTVGQLKNAQQNPKLPENMKDIDLDNTTKLWIRQAIDDVAEAVYPKLAKANQKWAQLSDVERAVEETSVRNRAVPVGSSAAARTEVVPELMYAGATTPLWAIVPYVRELGQRQILSKYNKAFVASDPQALYDLAAQRPLGTAAQMLGAGLLSPFRQGEFGFGE